MRVVDVMEVLTCAGGRCDGGLDIKIIAAIVVGGIAALIILILLIVLIIYLVKRSKRRKNQAGSYRVAQKK